MNLFTSLLVLVLVLVDDDDDNNDDKSYDNVTNINFFIFRLSTLSDWGTSGRHQQQHQHQQQKQHQQHQHHQGKPMKLMTFEVIILDKMLKCTVLLSYAVGKQLLKLLCRLETKKCSHKSLLLKSRNPMLTINWCSVERSRSSIHFWD